VTHDKFSEIITTMALLVRPCTLVHKRMPKPRIHDIHICDWVCSRKWNDKPMEGKDGVNEPKTIMIVHEHHGG